MRSHELLQVYFDVSLKVAVILCLAVVAQWLLPKAAAATRHWVWTVALCACLGLPALMTVLPAWRLPLLTAPIAPVAAAAHTANVPAVEIKYAPQWQTEPFEAPPAVAKTTPPSVPWSFWVLAFWGLGAWLVSARTLIGFVSVGLIERRAHPLQDEAWHALVVEVTTALRLKQRVSLWLSDAVSVPMTTGVFRPRVLLPMAALKWSPAQCRTVLLHELAHVKRRDCLTQMLAQVACALYWCNPLVWLAAWQLRQLREQACDDEVLAVGTRASDYASCLVDVAKAVKPARYASSVAVGMACSQLSKRVTTILNPAINRRKITRSVSMLIVLLGLTLVLPLAALQPYSQAAPVAAPLALAQEQDAKKQQQEIEKHLREIEKHRREITDVHQREIEKHVRALEEMKDAALTEAQRAKLDAELERAMAAQQSAEREFEAQTRERVTVEMEEKLRAEAERMQQRSQQDAERLVQEELTRAMQAQQSSSLTSKAQADLLERRAELNAELQRLQRMYTEKHPEVIEHRAQLEALTERLAGIEQERAMQSLSHGRAQLEMKLAELEAQLKVLQRQYTNKHPEVLEVKAQIEALRQELERSLRK